MKFDVGNDLRIQGVRYLVLGSILYEDRASNDRWEEYRLLNHDNRSESWLSYDEGNQEYEMSFMCNESTPPEGFRLVDSGTQVVRGRSGSVDVDRGETAQYETWEDAEELHTYSVERWSDGPEYSRGMYVELSDIEDLGPSPDAPKRQKKPLSCFFWFWVIIAFIALLFAGIAFTGSSMQTNVNRLLANDSLTYTKVNEASADDKTDEVATTYSSTLNVELTAKDIIAKLEGAVQSVREDDDNQTVALLTYNEYILVYQPAGEDGLPLDDSDSTAEGADADGKDAAGAGASFGDADGSTSESTSDSTDEQSASAALVQVSSRRYAYTTDRRPYRASHRAYRWYRRFYYAIAYSSDAKSYGGDTSSYSSYTGETSVSSSSTSPYESYAETIRQQSAATKKSSGGGTSYGK